MKKIVKVIGVIIVVVLVLLLAAVITLPLTIGPIVKTAAATAGPKVLGVPVAVGDVKLKPLAGNLVVSGVKIGNPGGYSDKDAFAVDQIEVTLNIRSLATDTILINKIQIDAPAISFETKKGTSNFDAMMANVKKEEKEEKEKPVEKEKAEPGKKVIIEEFSLNDAKVAYASGMTLGKSVTLPLPSLTLNDIGKASGGATAAEAISQIMTGVMGGITKIITDVAGGAGDLLKGLGDKAGSAAKEATKALEGAKDIASGATEAASEAAKSATKALSGATDGVKDLTSGASASAGEAVQSLTKALGGLTGGTKDAAAEKQEGAAQAGAALKSDATAATDGAVEQAQGAREEAQKTVESVEESAKSAADAVKKLNPFRR